MENMKVWKYVYNFRKIGWRSIVKKDMENNVKLQGVES